ncbi:MAG TPA: ABC-F family ATP-binding cassette domain-containing protein [Bacteroidales bacterium]|nr:ABC-F family ATP-binding cassette domain-containing protein [Bacteroidales bacterium]HOL98113.1 ABC-F family ATP-binding cassette domain-containing protein [Bacteroidales bacterium]HPD23753.1 ABC-F family ATP-binding cassette domain-containing protein [Bacteroidales bacterium]HRS99769.1 ABC-F family ATP-binding cassette domain-containing protein [Bacteroidales bacterium]HRT79812.1 ABC-F family ATP-binding cassette domain-containing protein [Bacteroidales bacterium]
MSSLLQAENLCKRYGEKLLFENINIYISEEQKLALVAKNGTGKTSLLNILAGKDSPDSGELSFKRGIRISYLPQEICFPPNMTVLQAVFYQEDEIISTIREYNKIIASKSHDGLQGILDKMDSMNAWDYEARVRQILGKLDIHDFDAQIGTLSGGQLKRVALAGTLICEPDLLILDEPTNHLDLEMIEWLEEYLSKIPAAVFMVTHDRYFLDRVCDTILEMEDGNIFTYNGNYSYFLAKRTERIENLQANIERYQNLFRQEQEWIRRMPKARTTKAKYRVEAFDENKQKAFQKIDNSKLELDIATERLGKKVIDIYNISKSFGDKVLFRDFSYKIARNEKIGIVGNNGSGKTTFLEIIAGNLKPDSGHIEIGTTVKIAYYKQIGLNFDPDDRPIDIVRKISDSIKLKNGKTFSASGFLNYFLFNHEMQYTLVRKLSGGEKRRLYLCTVLMQQPNVLIMDEPTNDLDIITLQVLEEYLNEIEASVIIVSHDRFFMDKIVDHIFAFDGKGNIKDFAGNYTQFRDSDLHEKLKLDEKQKNLNQKLEKNIRKPKVEDGTKPRKLSFKEKYELENLEKELQELYKLRQELEKHLNSGVLTHEELIEKSKAYAILISKIDDKEIRWMELTDI